jgi:hypothetical protein
MNWLMLPKLEHREQRIVLEELLGALRQESERVERLEQAIRDVRCLTGDIRISRRPAKTAGSESVHEPPHAVRKDRPPHSRENAQYLTVGLRQHF